MRRLRSRRGRGWFRESLRWIGCGSWWRGASEGAEAGESVGEDAEGAEDAEEHEAEHTLCAAATKYEATTVGGLVSEMAGHIPLPGEVVEDGPLRLEVIASTDRRVERVRVGLMGNSEAA